MEDASTGESSDATPIKANAKPTGSSALNKTASCHNPLSKKSQRKVAKVAKKDGKHSKDGIPRHLSSATKATLERARKAKEALTKTIIDSPEDISLDTNTTGAEENTPLSGAEDERTEGQNNSSSFNEDNATEMLHRRQEMTPRRMLHLTT